MKFGVLIRIQNTLDFFERAKQDDYSRPPSIADQKIVQDQIRHATLVEELGYDAIWVLEEHFSSTAMTGRPLQLATAIAARTQTVDLGVVLSLSPLRDPVGTAEGISLLDNLLGGRELTIALGHPAAPHECEALGLKARETSQRLIESSEIVQSGLSNEWFSYSGKHWAFGATTLRPRPLHQGWQSRILLSSLASNAGDKLAAHAAGLMHMDLSDLQRAASADATWRHQRAGLELPYHDSMAALPIFCSHSKSEVDAAREWWAQAFDGEVWHYGINHHPATRKAAAAHKGKALIAEINRIYDLAKYAGIFGSPEECLGHLERIDETVPLAQLVGQMQFGLMPIEAADRSLRLFAEQVLPAWRERRQAAQASRDVAASD